MKNAPNSASSETRKTTSPITAGLRFERYGWICGVLWSAAALDAGIDDYPLHRTFSRQRLAAEMQRRFRIDDGRLSESRT